MRLYWIPFFAPGKRVRVCSNSVFHLRVHAVPPECACRLLSSLFYTRRLSATTGRSTFALIVCALMNASAVRAWKLCKKIIQLGARIKWNGSCARHPGACVCVVLRGYSVTGWGTSNEVISSELFRHFTTHRIHPTPYYTQSTLSLWNVCTLIA